MASFQPLKRKRGANEAGKGSDELGFDLAPRSKRVHNSHMQRADVVKHAVLAQCYPSIQTLRAYILAQLPSSSRLRRKKISLMGKAGSPASQEPTEMERSLGHLLDTTLVASQEGITKPLDKRREQWQEYGQKGDESYVTLSGGKSDGHFYQSEVVDFAVWLLFSREPAANRPSHILCDGYRRSNLAHSGLVARGHALPGLLVVHRNRHVEALKQSPWTELLLLLGKAGEEIMIDLLLDCSIFPVIEAGKGNLYQLSGPPIFDVPAAVKCESKSPKPQKPVQVSSELSAVDITFVRSRMMYARAALSARGQVHFGLRHIHVLNRFPLGVASLSAAAAEGAAEACNHERWDESTVHVMMYMFPRQFRLHNVFTSPVDRQRTAQKFHDYTLREDEIGRVYPQPDGGAAGSNIHLPRRLRGTPMELVRSLRVLHERCSYFEILRHYCPIHPQSDPAQDSRQPASNTASRKPINAQREPEYIPGATKSSQPSSLVALATPVAHVSAFCQAALAKVVPDSAWGTGSLRAANKNLFLKKIDHFVRLRKFETMSLHEALDGFKFANLEWLVPPNLKGQKCCQSETRKRREIFAEFIYYLFDSFLMPLIRSNFYVTESNIHRSRLFFFRHDAWRNIAEPAMSALRTKMFEEVKLDDALRILDSRRLAFSQVRLLPKETTMRPIMNLRRRTQLRGKEKLLGPSINSVLEPVNSMLKLEKRLNPETLGSSMFSVGDIYKRIKEFKCRDGSDVGQRYYFAKVDVQAAFDTIPQDAVMQVMQNVPGQTRYKFAKHVAVQVAEHGLGHGDRKTSRRWHSTARDPGDDASFPDFVAQQFGAKSKNTVFVDNIVQRSMDTKSLMKLMSAHIRENLVKIGKKFYRQREGIPQGSVLSSTLCNYFYAELERQHLDFLRGSESLLLRLIDDLLLITTNLEKAVLFVETMLEGLAEFGVVVSPGKTLVNFNMVWEGENVPSLPEGSLFPYCGTLIDCHTLEISKDRAKSKDLVIFNSLTVEFSRRPGRSFKKKVLNAFKIQSHLMYFDTSHNSRRITLRNIYSAFLETAVKTWAYARCLSQTSQPSSVYLIGCIIELVDVAYRLLSSKSRTLRYPGYHFGVNKRDLAWLAMTAFSQCLARKQTKYGSVLSWLEQETQKLSRYKDVNCEELVKSTKGFADIRP